MLTEFNRRAVLAGLGATIAPIRPAQAALTPPVRFTAQRMTGDELRELYFAHPDTCPQEFTAPMDYLIEPPSWFAPTASFIRFRDKTILPLIAAYPDHPDFPNFLKQIEIVLAWRAAIPPEQRFWRPHRLVWCEPTSAASPRECYFTLPD